MGPPAPAAKYRKGNDVTEIAPGVHSLEQKIGGRVHAFLLESDDGLTLIDTLYDTDARLVLEAITALGRTARDLKRIVLTHSHRSHLGGLAALKNASGATVYSHEWEEDIIAGERKAQPAGLIPARPLLTYAKIYHFQAALALGIGKHPPGTVDRPLKDGDTVGPLEVLHTPGHSPGHLAFWWPERRALFTGDAVATWPMFAGGWPAFNINETHQRASLRRMAELDPEVLGVGHGDPILDDAAARLRSLVTNGR